MRKIIIFLLLGCLFLALASGVCQAREDESEFQPISVFEGAELYRLGQFNVVSLEGNYRDMGRQYGMLLGDEILGMYNEIVNQFTLDEIITSEEGLREFCMKLFDAYPKRFKELVYGIAETSGLDIGQVAVINGFFEYYLLRETSQCSAIAAWGDFTIDGQLFLGRNFDFVQYFKNFDRFLTVIAFNPTDGSNRTATIAYAGQVGAVQAFNERGLVLENNDGSSSGDTGRYTDRLSFLINDVQFMLDFSSLSSVGEAIKTNRLAYPLIFTVTSPNGAACYECTTYDVKERVASEEGLLVATNHFLNPEWGIAPPTPKQDASQTVLRWENLVSLANKSKGEIDAQRMRKIMDTTIKKGGATHPDCTIYQFVFEPLTMKLWLKARGFQDWTEIELTWLFD